MDRLSDYAYALPEELIAQIPLADRSASRLLVLHKVGAMEHRRFTDITTLLHPGDLLVMNDTRVSAIRLLGHKGTGAAVEALLMREVDERHYEAMVKPGKRLQPGTHIQFQGDLSAWVIANFDGGMKLIEFAPIDRLKQRLLDVGDVPLPPYIRTALADKSRYQTVYGIEDGSAAAPTAGLHFTTEMLDALTAAGVRTAKVTLNVGIDTFRPVQVEDLAAHKMHGETCTLSPDAAEAVNGAQGRIIAVGTTTVRTLESFAVEHRKVGAGTQDTRLFIRPGYRFKVVDAMFTNFHLPGTTMLMMIAAMVGREPLLKAYAEAVAEKYRFLSFGDSMLIV